MESDERVSVVFDQCEQDLSTIGWERNIIAVIGDTFLDLLKLQL